MNTNIEDVVVDVHSSIIVVVTAAAVLQVDVHVLLLSPHGHLDVEGIRLGMDDKEKNLKRQNPLQQFNQQLRDSLVTLTRLTAMQQYLMMGVVLFR